MGKKLNFLSLVFVLLLCTGFATADSAFSVDYDYPADGMANLTTRTTGHLFTPWWNNDEAPIMNCTLDINDSAYRIVNQSVLVNNTQSAITYTYLDDGYYKTFISCENGSTGHSSEIHYYTFDINPPTTPTLANVSNGVINIYLSTEGCGDGNGLGVEKMLLFRNLVNVHNITGGAAAFYNDTGLAEYTQYKYNLSCLDLGGHYGSNSTTLVVYTRDATAPTVPAIGPILDRGFYIGGGGFTLAWVNMTIGNCSDTGGGVAKRVFYVNDANLGNFSGGTITSSNLSGITAAAYVLKLACLDNFGHYSANSTYNLQVEFSTGSVLHDIILASFNLLSNIFIGFGAMGETIGLVLGLTAVVVFLVGFIVSVFVILHKVGWRPGK